MWDDDCCDSNDLIEVRKRAITKGLVRCDFYGGD